MKAGREQGQPGQAQTHAQPEGGRLQEGAESHAQPQGGQGQPQEGAEGQGMLRLHQYLISRLMAGMGHPLKASQAQVSGLVRGGRFLAWLLAKEGHALMTRACLIADIMAAGFQLGC